MGQDMPTNNSIKGKPLQHFLSKSRFLKGLQCYKALWLQTHRPDLQDKITAAQQAVFDSGKDVGKLAQDLFPLGIEIPFGGLTISQQLAMTQAEIKKGTETIYEAAFKHSGVLAKIINMQRILGQGIPVIDIGPHCFDPYECSFHGYCWQHIPSPSVFDFADIGKPDPFALYKQGIVKMEDVPTEVIGWRQQLQLDGILYQKNHFDAEAVKQFLQSLWYPLAFMDFETTCLTAIPLFHETRPFQAVPFQYSLHIQADERSSIEHYEFLAEADDDPRRQFIESLLSSVPQGACVIAWNKTFEERILRDLALSFPEFSDRIAAIIEGMVDLMAPFRAKHVYHWQFKGSYSIKAVLPALVPDLRYDDLPIKDGGLAADSWLRIRSGVSAEDALKIRTDLLDYCKLDTWGMVEILRTIREMAKESVPKLSKNLPDLNNVNF